MAAKRRGTKQAGNDGAVAQTKAEFLEQEVMRHYAKTVYFNDMWKSFLVKIAGLVLFMSFVALQKMHMTTGIGFGAAFEVLSLVIAAATVCFVHRAFNPLLAFKVGFSFSLLQVAWYGYVLHARLVLKQATGELSEEQFPFVAMYFFLCWAADRFMMKSQDISQATAEEVREVAHKMK